MKNVVRKVFDINGTWQCPGGVKRVTAKVYAMEHFKSAIALLNSQTYLSAANGETYGCGRGNSIGGETLGDGTLESRSSPVLVIGHQNFNSIAGLGGAGVGLYQRGKNSAGTFVDASVMVWGYGEYGTASNVRRSSPVAVVGLQNFAQISSADFTNEVQPAWTGLTVDGLAYSCGDNANGQLGDGTTTDRSSPVAVVGGHVFIKAVVGAGLKADGSVWTWGNNANGELGNGTTVSRSSPVAVIGGHKFKDIACQGLALREDGTAMAWGNNAGGALGDGTTISRSSPVAVIGGHKFIKLAGSLGDSDSRAIGLKEDGSAWVWGDGGTGLGDGTTTDRSSPVAVIGGHTFIDIATSRNHTGGVDSSGRFMVWGLNNDGELGDGTRTWRSSPVAVLGSIVARAFPREPVLVAEMSLEVTPGSSYNVVPLGSTVRLGSMPLYTNLSKRCRIVLEYFA
jgi:alpha-tubulin suppressor-like RCC1 family protein